MGFRGGLCDCGSGYGTSDGRGNRGIIRDYVWYDGYMVAGGYLTN